MARISEWIWEWLWALVVALGLALLIRQFAFMQFMVDGSSMEPTLHNRERIVVDKVIYRIHPPRYGDIVVFQYPGDLSLDYIKRVIGLPGDTIRIQDRKVFRNGVPLQEPYIAEPTLGEFGPMRVPPGHLFVLGDNRNHSKDSRDPSVGMVPLKDVVGRADLVFWPAANFQFEPFR